MAKRKKKKAPAFARTELFIIGLDAPVLLRESYSTVKRRLFNGVPFMEVTNKNGRKMTVNKNVINSTWPLD